MTSDSFQELLSAIRTSGQPPKRYCKEHGVHYSTYQYWLRKTKASLQTENSGFLKLVPIPAASASLEVRFPNGVVIAVRSGFDAGLLRAVVNALAT